MVFGFMLASVALARDGGRVNIALGRRYTLEPPPNHGVTTDPADTVQLTDGRHADGPLWTQRDAVGWSYANYVVVTIDLGAEAPISGASFDTAAGAAGVQFPTAIMVLVSVDGRAWYLAGDLVAESNELHGAPGSGYVHRFWTDQWRAHGRWVAFVVDVSGLFCFVDEVEVYGGDPAWLAGPLPGQPLRDVTAVLRQRGVLRRIDADAQRLEGLVKGLPPPLRDQLQQRLETLRRDAAFERVVRDAAASRATLPFSDNHEAILGVQASYWQARGALPFAAWVPPSNYDLLPYITDDPVPQAARKSADIILMRGETRSVAVNLVNAHPQVVTVKARIDGLSGCPADSCLQVSRVVWTDSRDGTPRALALERLDGTNGRFKLSVPPGLIEQLWLSVHPGPAMPPGDHGARVSLETDAADRVEVPLNVHVAAIDFPAQRSLHLGGWDYTDRQDLYGLTANNRDLLVKVLQQYLVDLPWGSPTMLAPGRYDRDGNMVEPPNTAAFDSWVLRWRGAFRYQVFVNAGNTFEGAQIQTPAFERKVSQWIRFWAQHARDRGLQGKQLALLLVDEPRTLEQDARIVAWASVIRKAAPDVVIWENPTWEDPRKMNRSLFELCDVFCPLRTHWLRGGLSFSESYESLRAKGIALGLYAANGPSAELDPYSYYRLHAWQAFAAGASETHFWSFADTGGSSSSWNPYLTPHVAFSPLFMTPDSVTPTKQMEAIREGVQDYETLAMLRAVVARRRPRADADDQLGEAKRLLSTGVQEVLVAAGEHEFNGGNAHDRVAADRVRAAALRLLEAMEN